MSVEEYDARCDASAGADGRIDVTETTFSWVREFVGDRDAHLEREGGRTFLVLD